MSVKDLVDLVYEPVDEKWHERAHTALRSLWGEGGRYPQRAEKQVTVRERLIRDGCPFAALIHPDNPNSGPYRGTSFVIFPTRDAPALVGLVVGTDGVGPDADVLGRPGHARKCMALAKWINRLCGTPAAWAKHDPIRTQEPLPRGVRESSHFAPHQGALSTYGSVMYLLFSTVDDRQKTEDGLTAILDLFFEERGIEALAAFRNSRNELRAAWLGQLFPVLAEEDIREALKVHKYVVLQGPPGTGKTRAALHLARSQYPGGHEVIQFHANTSYETFVGGLAPRPAENGIAFEPRAGHLLRAIARANEAPFLLVVDEINRADLAKVMGEALYLFEPESDVPRTLELEYAYSELGGRTVTMPADLRILGTMNTADRSIAIVDLAVRRRFAFLDVWPERSVVASTGSELAVEAFDRLVALFVEYASEDAFSLLPGHSYFLGNDDFSIKLRLRNSLLPLLREYLQQGFVAGFSGEMRAYMQWLEYATA